MHYYINKMFSVVVVIIIIIIIISAVKLINRVQI